MSETFTQDHADQAQVGTAYRQAVRALESLVAAGLSLDGDQADELSGLLKQVSGRKAAAKRG